MHPEFLINCGPNTRKWLSKFYTDIQQSGTLPPELRKSKIIAIVKPGKSNDRPENYRPIALLSACYKLLERIIYNRISPIILNTIPVEQAGFRPGRSCSDQVLSLTTYIEAGFRNRLKSAAVFIDLTAAYDTVWRQGLLYRLLHTIRCRNTVQLINTILTNRSFKVHMNDKISNSRTLNNGLAQGSVLAPLLFNVYIADLPMTHSIKFAYADDLAIVNSTHRPQ
ncbi:Reverse transcriptase domain [Cinara cedri]|uniref:Reverse transcriptase domain n=1 Tax=Cinara cedri TaxID=506608 RepID=A0A5E4N4P7_9HEMI|nr:Reverse transcriptase domain [Cinara cedri]